jgi:hypothetical protein
MPHWGIFEYTRQCAEAIHSGNRSALAAPEFCTARDDVLGLLLLALSHTRAAAVMGSGPGPGA